MSDPSDLLTFAQAGEMIRCGPATIRRLVREGHLGEEKVPEYSFSKPTGRLVPKVRRSDLEALCTKNGNTEVSLMPSSDPDRCPGSSGPLGPKVAGRGFSKP